MNNIDDTRPFKIQGKPYTVKASAVPWWLAEIAFEYYSKTYGTRQTLERINERGGFGREELVALLRREDI